MQIEGRTAGVSNCVPTRRSPRLVVRSFDFLSRLSAPDYDGVVSRLPAWYPDPNAETRESRTNLSPERMDSLEKAGAVNPSAWLSADVTN